MKNLLHNIQTIAVLALLMVGIQSCTQEWEEAAHVEVNFTAMLPNDAQSRAFGEGIHVNKLVVGIFDDRYSEISRKNFPISGENIEIQLTLAQDQTYHFVFWAYNNEHDFYDTTDLTAIQMNAVESPVTFEQMEAADAFFATIEDFEVTDGKRTTVELIRPLAQINVGTSGKTMKALLTAKGVSDTFHPFENAVSGKTDYIWGFSQTTSEKFMAEDTEYTYLAMGYVFAPTEETSIAAELILTDGEASLPIEFPEVKIRANHKSNIAGNLTN